MLPAVLAGFFTHRIINQALFCDLERALDGAGLETSHASLALLQKFVL